jgi:hypothetical protein
LTLDSSINRQTQHKNRKNMKSFKLIHRLGAIMGIFWGLGVSEAQSQTNWTGTYRVGDPHVKESAQGSLEIVHNQAGMRFWLSYSDQGQQAVLEGIITEKNGQFIHTNPKNSCTIIFQPKSGELILSQDSDSKTCGLANGMDISGSYQKTQHSTQNIK